MKGIFYVFFSFFYVNGLLHCYVCTYMYVYMYVCIPSSFIFSLSYDFVVAYPFATGICVRPCPILFRILPFVGLSLSFTLFP